MLNPILLQLLAPPVIKEKMTEVATKILSSLLIIGGVIWLSIATYSYFMDNFDKAYAAFISSTIFFGATLIIKLIGASMQKKYENENYISNITKEAYPLIEDANKKFKTFVQQKGLLGAASTGLGLLLLYKTLRRK